MQSTLSKQTATGFVRQRHWLDGLICEADVALRVLAGVTNASRPNPAAPLAKDEPATLDAQQQRHAAGLMRINQVGEVCAQALYRSQALVCRDTGVQELLAHAAQEEIDHLAWCNDRLSELNSRASLLNPAWYAGAFMLGLAAARAGVDINLGFMAETERQVEVLLNDHLQRLPREDKRSRAIVAQMRDDEAGHRVQAEQNGAVVLPVIVKLGMGFMSKCMTTLAYRV
jgi:ubiquinone biosynthesis monooxygenase Coq7